MSQQTSYGLITIRDTTDWTDMIVLYYLSDDPVNAPASPTYNSSTNIVSYGGWLDSPPSWENGKYIWQIYMYIYQDDLETTIANVEFSDPICLTGSSGADGQMLYGKCTTAASTVQKSVTLTSGTLTLTSGAIVAVTFTNANTANNPTLKVGSTAAKTIRIRGANLTASSKYNWTANSTIIFVYDGTYWQMDGTTAAATTASSYITDVTNGVFVHPKDNETDGVVITDDVQIKRDNTVVATYGENITIGADGGKQAQVGNGYFSILDENSDPQLVVGGTSAIRTGSSFTTSINTRIGFIFEYYGGDYGHGVNIDLTYTNPTIYGCTFSWEAGSIENSYKSSIIYGTFTVPYKEEIISGNYRSTMVVDFDAELENMGSLSTYDDLDYFELTHLDADLEDFFSNIGSFTYTGNATSVTYDLPHSTQDEEQAILYLSASGVICDEDFRVDWEGNVYSRNNIYCQGAIIDGNGIVLTNAAKTASNYIVADSDGIMVADMSNGVEDIDTATSRNVYIDSDSINIRKGTDVLAEFGEIVTVGNKEDSALILSSDSIQGTGKDGKNFFEFSGQGDSTTVWYTNKKGAEFKNSNKQFIINLLQDNQYNTNLFLTISLDVPGYDTDSISMKFTKGVSETKSGVFSGSLENKSIECEYIWTNSNDGTSVFNLIRPTWCNEIFNFVGKLEYSKTTVAPTYNIGSNNTVKGAYGYSEGLYNTVNGVASHAEGYNNSATGPYAHAEGYYTQAPQLAAHTEGFCTYATGSGSHAEGYGYYQSSTNISRIQAIGYGSHAEGYIADIDSTIRSGDSTNGYGSHAEGYASSYYGSIYASAHGAHAEGAGTTASGFGSHAEGIGTTASGRGSHTEGSETTASYNDCHAEGTGTTALNYASHAEGIYTTASGDYSHAQNYYTITSQNAQTAIGTYNIEDSTPSTAIHPNGSIYYGTYAFIIGNGTSDTARSNALAVSWAGNIYSKGDIYVKDHDSPVGTVVEGTLSLTTCTTVGTLYSQGTISLTAGTWIVDAHVAFTNMSNYTYRMVAISEASNVSRNVTRVAAVNGNTTNVPAIAILSLSSSAIYYLVTASGTANTPVTSASFRAVRIA